MVFNQKWPDALPRRMNQRFEKIESKTSWFEIYRINHETFALLEPHHDEEVISFLLPGKNMAALIDTGLGVSNIKTEVRNLTCLPIMAINTHSHFDHIGDNHRFAEVACFDDAYELNNISQGWGKEYCKHFMQPESYVNLPPDFKPEEYSINPAKVTRKLGHLDEINLGNRVLTIHHTPGHSPGSICIEDVKHKLLFTGDTYYRGNLLFNLPGSVFQDFLKTVGYLKSIVSRVEALCPSHKECFAPPDDIILLHESVKQITGGQAKAEEGGMSKLYGLEHCNLRLI